jgi:hypothetical protein
LIVIDGYTITYKIHLNLNTVSVLSIDNGRRDSNP